MSNVVSSILYSPAQLVKILEVLGAYNMTVKELKGILSYLYATQAWVRAE